MVWPQGVSFASIGLFRRLLLSKRSPREPPLTIFGTWFSAQQRHPAPQNRQRRHVRSSRLSREALARTPDLSEGCSVPRARAGASSLSDRSHASHVPLSRIANSRRSTPRVVGADDGGASSRGPRGRVRWRASARQVALHRGPQQKPTESSGRERSGHGPSARRPARRYTRSRTPRSEAERIAPTVGLGSRFATEARRDRPSGRSDEADRAKRGIQVRRSARCHVQREGGVLSHCTRPARQRRARARAGRLPNARIRWAV